MTPIYVRCEGSGCPPAHSIMNFCSMCGAIVPTDYLDRCVEHKRKDILAMLDRGDFN